MSRYAAMVTILCLIFTALGLWFFALAFENIERAARDGATLEDDLEILADE
jgi:hypothetical protein